MNCRSLLSFSKSRSISDFILKNNYPIAIFLETWLHSEISDNELFMSDYKVVRSDRNINEHGGILVICKTSYLIQVVELSYSSTDWLPIKIGDGINYFLFLIIYNAPNGSKYRSSIIALTQILTEFIDYAKFHKFPYMILGDFNLPSIDWSTNTSNTDEGDQFLDIIAKLNLYQNVYFTTHIAGNTFDLIFTDICYHVDISQCENSPVSSDHHPILVKFGTMINNRAGIQNLPVNLPNWTIKNLDAQCFKDISAKFNDYCDHLSSTNLHGETLLKHITGHLQGIFTTYAHKRKHITAWRRNLPVWISATTSHFLHMKVTIEARCTRKQSICNLLKLNNINQQINFCLDDDFRHFIDRGTINSGNNKALFSYMNALKRSDTCHLISANNNKLTADATIAHEFNVYFNSVYTNADDKFNVADRIISDNIPILREIRISYEDILRAINDSKVADDKSVLSTNVLKVFKSSIIPIISILFNDIINSKIFPEA